MDTATDLLELLSDDYIGDDLTIEDLRSAYSAFLEDEKSELEGLIALDLT
jgi:hypothetical protein